MSLLSGMNGMLNNERALESALEMADETSMIAMEADEIIDAMVDGTDDDDLDDELEDMEEDALEASLDLQIQMDKVAESYVKDGMAEAEAYQVAFEGMMTCAESFYEDPDDCQEVQNMLTKIAEENPAIESTALVGNEFLKSLVEPDDDTDAEDGSLGPDSSAADFDGNSSLWGPDTDDPNKTKDGSVGNVGGAVPDHKDNASTTDHLALESLMNEMEEEDDADDDLDDAFASMLC